MLYKEIAPNMKVTIGTQGREIWTVLEPIQLTSTSDGEAEEDYNNARVYCECEHDSFLQFLPIKMLKTAPTCPKCDTTLKFISTRKGAFLGCRNHPKCSHYTPVKYDGNYNIGSTLHEAEAWNH